MRLLLISNSTNAGEAYLEHPLQVASTLAELQLDGSTLAAALLHDVLENCGVPV